MLMTLQPEIYTLIVNGWGPLDVVSRCGSYEQRADIGAIPSALDHKLTSCHSFAHGWPQHANKAARCMVHALQEHKACNTAVAHTEVGKSIPFWPLSYLYFKGRDKKPCCKHM